MTNSTLSPQTLLVQGGVIRSQFGETAEALFLTSGFVYESAEQAEATFAGAVQHYRYSRSGNPTVAMLEARLAALEGAEACRATASGMAAVHAALLSSLKAGDRVVASRALFGSNHWIVSTLLPRFGIETEFVDGSDLDGWRNALRRPAALVLLETPSNPMLEIIDLASVSSLAHAAGAKVVVDNVFATPLLQKPLALGADIVVYSATKHIDGQGRVLGGAVLGSNSWIDGTLHHFLRNTGGVLSPFNAWLLLKGLETLALRVTAQSAAAARIADFLSRRPEVARVWYPFRDDHAQAALARRQMSGGGTVVTFALAGGKSAAFAAMNALKLTVISNNLGDTKSLATHPATTTHARLPEAERARLGITGSVIRLSVGLEDPADLEADLAQALSHARIAEAAE
ncbi:MAG: O-succinylhomoserine sulfhydrylase [Acetobacteraceae bacterium]